jgi:Na+/H+ antiporter NhaD/arsenite permease-like protein
MILARVVSGLLFGGMLYLIFSEKVNRLIVGMAGAFGMVLIGKVMGFYSETQALASIDFGTIGLLLGMMILVALLEPTGVFQFLALWAGRISKGSNVRLLILLGGVTTILSMLLDNVTTVVLIAPITILICEIIGIKATPYLISEALLSNIGGAATLIGDPPNVLIGSAAGFSFNDFLLNTFPIVLFSWLISLGLIRFLFRKELSEVPENIQALDKLDPSEALEDIRALRRILIVLAGVILLFFLEDFLHISSTFIAMGGAAIAFLWVRPDVESILKRIDWQVLLFFSSLFIAVGGVEASGLLAATSSALSQLDNMPIVLFGVLIIWFTGILSAVIDNVPMTIAFIPIIEGLAKSGMNVTPLWWALVLGAGFGGNATIIGATANIIVASISEKTRNPITAQFWSQVGLPVMLASCAAASILYVVLYINHF